MNDWLEWLPWVAVACIPGIFNTVAAFEELEERCKLLPFFKPFRTPGVWLWGVIQFLFPAGLFWGAASLGTRPEITVGLIGQAIVAGLGFITLLNAHIQIGARSLPIKSAYTFFVNVAYRMIASSQDDRVYEFWIDVEDALKMSPDLVEGLRILEEYFEFQEGFIQQPLGNYREELRLIRATGDRAEQARRIKALLKRVRRRRLFGILRRFNISNTLLMKYYPSRFSQAKSAR